MSSLVSNSREARLRAATAAAAAFATHLYVRANGRTRPNWFLWSRDNWSRRLRLRLQFSFGTRHTSLRGRGLIYFANAAAAAAAAAKRENTTKTRSGKRRENDEKKRAKKNGRPAFARRITN